MNTKVKHNFHFAAIEVEGTPEFCREAVETFIAALPRFAPKPPAPKPARLRLETKPVRPVKPFKTKREKKAEAAAKRKERARQRLTAPTPPAITHDPSPSPE